MRTASQSYTRDYAKGAEANKMTTEEELLKELNCDELCFVEGKTKLREAARELEHEKQCPPCNE